MRAPSTGSGSRPSRSPACLTAFGCDRTLPTDAVSHRRDTAIMPISAPLFSPRPKDGGWSSLNRRPPDLAHCGWSPAHDHLGFRRGPAVMATAKLCIMIADLDALVALMPFAGQLGVVLDEASPDRVIAQLDWAPHLCTSGGIMHGGVLMSLADTAGALVTFLGLPEGASTAPITSTTPPFRRPGRSAAERAARWPSRCTAAAPRSPPSPACTTPRNAWSPRPPRSRPS